MEQADTHDPDAAQHLPALATPEAELLETFKALSARTPKDRNGFPSYFLDHMHLPPDILIRSEKQQKAHIDAAKIPLSLLEGYLSFNFNVPVWEQLDHEPSSYYSVFNAYLNMPVRDMYELSKGMPAMSPAVMQSAYVLYYWEERSRAYDLLRPVAAAKLRDQRVLMTEDTHFQFSSRVLNQLGQELTQRTEDQEGRPFAGMTAKHLIEAVSQMTEMQRIALRIPAKGARNFGDEGMHMPQHASMERGLDASISMHDGEKEGSTKASNMRRKVDAAIASDPDKAADLQQAAMDILMNVTGEAANHDRSFTEDE